MQLLDEALYLMLTLLMSRLEMLRARKTCLVLWCVLCLDTGGLVGGYGLVILGLFLLGAGLTIVV